jgi:hypothetical protein
MEPSSDIENLQHNWGWDLGQENMYVMRPATSLLACPSLCGTGTLAGACFLQKDPLAQAGVPVPHISGADNRVIGNAVHASKARNTMLKHPAFFS